jgi:hypothetical protein
MILLFIKKTDITDIKNIFFVTKKYKNRSPEKKRRRIFSLQDLGSVKAVDKVIIQ